MSAQRVEIIHTVEEYKGKSHKFDPDKAYIVDGQEVHIYAFKKIDPPKDQVTIVLASQMQDPQADMVPIEVEDAELNAIADQRINGPFVPVVLEGMSDRAKVQAMRDANWTPASTYLRLRAEAAEEAREMAVCQAFSAGYEAGQRDAITPLAP